MQNICGVVAQRLSFAIASYPFCMPRWMTTCGTAQASPSAEFATFATHFRRGTYATPQVCRRRKGRRNINQSSRRHGGPRTPIPANLKRKMPLARMLRQEAPQGTVKNVLPLKRPRLPTLRCGPTHGDRGGNSGGARGKVGGRKDQSVVEKTMTKNGE